MSSLQVRRLTYAALYLAIAMVLPFVPSVCGSRRATGIWRLYP